MITLAITYHDPDGRGRAHEFWMNYHRYITSAFYGKNVWANELNCIVVDDLRTNWNAIVASSLDPRVGILIFDSEVDLILFKLRWS